WDCSCRSLLLRLGDEGQGVDRTTDLGPEHRVDAAMLLDAAQPGELRGHHGRAKMVSASREVGDFCARTGSCGLDAVLQVVGRWHQVSSLAVATLRIVITFTDKGAEKVQEFLASQSADIQTSGLRVGVRGGGCSGFQYALAFDTQRDGDEVFEDHGLRI